MELTKWEQKELARLEKNKKAFTPTRLKIIFYSGIILLIVNLSLLVFIGFTLYDGYQSYQGEKEPGFAFIKQLLLISLVNIFGWFLIATLSGLFMWRVAAKTVRLSALIIKMNDKMQHHEKSPQGF